MDQENIEDVQRIKEKKKLALFIAGGITLLIFVGWAFYFWSKASEVIKNSEDEVALFEKLKQNTGDAFENIGSVFNDISSKVSSFGEFYEQNLSTTTATTSSDTNIETQQ